MPTREQTFRIAIRKFEPFQTALSKQWNAFTQAHPSGLHLEVVPFDMHALYESLFQERGLQSGTWDLAMIGTDWLSEAEQSAALEDLMPYIQHSPPEGFPAAWSESLLRLQTFEDRLLGLPYHDGPECLIYRKDLFAAEQLSIPQTWEEFHRVARLLTSPQD